MKRGLTGGYVTISSVGERCKAFVPFPLPPEPPLQMGEKLEGLMEKAILSLGRLDGITERLPEPSLFLYMYIRKEALLSSQIEGTQSSLEDLLLFEIEGAPGVPIDDVQEVSNYVAAINHGLDRIRENFPLSLRLLGEIHRILLSKGRGEKKEPGELRKSQNWIGGSRPGNARFVPPPPDKIMDCLGPLEKFLNGRPVKTPTLIKAALTHVQFETIHPFLDGNGRLGRLLITLLLCAEGMLSQPMLYLSLFFKTYRQNYYELLQKVRLEGDWESWLEFFLTGVYETADQAIKSARQLTQLFDSDRKKIQTLKKAAGSALRVHQFLQHHPIASIPKISKQLMLSVPSVTLSLTNLQKIGLVREITGHRRNRLFSYDQYLKILREGTEPLPG